VIHARNGWQAKQVAEELKRFEYLEKQRQVTISTQDGSSSGSFETSADYAAETAQAVSQQAESVARSGQASIHSRLWSTRILAQVVALPSSRASLRPRACVAYVDHRSAASSDHGRL
jgi:hypothetical protein